MATATVEAAIKQYFAIDGYSRRSAEELGPELELTANMTDAEVVNHVRDKPAMAIHRHLTWHDYTAAELYRQLEVRQMRRKIQVRIIRPDGNEIESRAVYRVKVTTLDLEDTRVTASGHPAKVAIPYEEAIQRPSVIDETMTTAIRELAAFRRKYRHLAQLFGEERSSFRNLFSAIDVVLDEEEAV